MPGVSWKRIVLSVPVMCLALVSRAQYFSVGNDPAAARWSQIRSEHFTLIFPEETDSLAREYLSKLEWHRPQVFESVGVKGKRIPVVLHPYTTLSNGTVTWAPKRIDLYTSPDAYDGTSDPWISQLTTHELRHQAQMEVYTQGVFKVLYYPFGESISGLGAGLYIGSTYMEGDAVISETELLKGGRGRSAEFMRWYRMAAITGDDRSYYRYGNGSYRYYTPNKYAFGYHMTSSARLKSGDYYFTGKYQQFGVDNWINLKLIFAPYKVMTGFTKREHWKWGWQQMKSFWKEDIESRGRLTEGTFLTSKERRLYSEYKSPVPITDSASIWFGDVIAIRSGFEESAVLISIDGEGKERVICPFNSLTSDLEYSPDGRLYWTERLVSGGSTLEDFSVLRYLDLRKGSVHTYPDRRTKWFNPSVSRAGRYVTVTEYPVGGSSFAVVMDSRSGEIMDRIEAPSKGQIKETAYIGEDLYASVIGDAGLGIYLYGGNEWHMISAPQNQSVTRLRSTDSLLYFCSDLDGVQNIYTLNPGDGTLVRITNSRYGADYPFLLQSDSSLMCSDFGSRGFRPVMIPKDSLTAVVCSFDAPYQFQMAKMLAEQRGEQSHIRPDTISVPDFADKDLFPTKKYSKGGHLFHFHSWAPFYYNVDEIMSITYDTFYNLATLGAVGYSQNTLGTAVTMVGYSAHRGSAPETAEGKKWFHTGHVKFTYKTVPYIEASVDFNDRYRIHYEGVDISKEGTYYNDSTKCYITDSYPMHVNTSLRLYYPISMSSGGWIRSLVPQFRWGYTNDEYITLDGSARGKHQMVGGVSFSQMRPLAHSQLFPRWGFSLTAMVSAAPWCGETYGNLEYLRGFVYLPGITRTQGLKLGFMWQYQHVNDVQYLLSNLASMPKGYLYSSPTVNYRKVEATYAIPVYLGDVHLGWDFGLYIKRLQILPFYECALDTGRNGSDRFFSSYGCDFLFDFKILPVNAEISAGVRYARIGEDLYWTSSGLKEANRNKIQLLFTVSL